MNINNKINKISKIINNNKDLLNSKYKERNDLLENTYINKDVKFNDLEKLDKYVESVELENKKLENELEELKKLYSSDINIKKDKTQLCKYYRSPKGCDKGDKCTFAHSEIELKKIKKPCISGLKCYKQECKYSHPEGWDYKNNIIICEYYKKGYCINEDNCRFKHVKENDEIIDNIEVHENKYDYIKDIVKGFIHEDIIYDIIEDNKKKNNNYDIDNDDLSLNFKITVDGVEYENEENIFNKVNFVNMNSSNQEVENNFLDIDNTEDNIIKLINNLQNDFDKYIKEIKKNIDETFINDKKKYGINLKLELNKIMYEILLFKNNYEDVNVKKT